MPLTIKDFQPGGKMADDEKKVEITLLTDCKVDNETVGKRGETHKFGFGIAAMLVNNGLAVEGKQKVDIASEHKVVSADSKPKV